MVPALLHGCRSRRHGATVVVTTIAIVVFTAALAISSPDTGCAATMTRTPGAVLRSLPFGLFPLLVLALLLCLFCCFGGPAATASVSSRH